MPASYQDSKPATAKVNPNGTFKERGFKFIPIRPAHISFIAAALDRKPPEFNRIAGKAMVDHRYMLLGFAMVVFEDDHVALHAYFGDWMRTFTKDILREIHNFLNRLRDQDVTEVYAVADTSVDGSDTLIEWMGGVHTGKSADIGPIYMIDLTKAKI